MKIIYNIEIAKSTLLKRLPAESVELPLQTKGRIKEVFGKELTPEEVVRLIITDVQTGGDAALLKYVEKLDRASLTRMEVPGEEIVAARNNTDGELLAALQTAAQRINDFHQKQRDLQPGGKIELGEGLGQFIAPLERVGIYAPGGTASYPSTVLMTAIPARVAGVNEIILTTPPRPDGHIPPLTLAAADIAGVDRVFSVGGAQAIAALAFGTESIPRVDKICGPGNIFVMLAKKQVFGAVDIDGLQGPTETIVLADECANPASCAADLLAQAEHDELASAIMITTSPELAREVNAEVEHQLIELERRRIAGVSLEQRGGIVVVSDMDEAIQLINDYAPEHLCLLLRDAEPIAARIRNAGGIFIGENSPEVIGDYVAGPSHVMPTGGTARFSSPLSVTDFLKITSLIALDKKDFKTLGPGAATIARAEGLTAHAAAIERRVGLEYRVWSFEEGGGERSLNSIPNTHYCIEKLIRRHLPDLEPYESIDPMEVMAERSGIPTEQVIKLDANENPYGCSPRVQLALGKADSYHIYSDPSNRELRRLLGEYTGLDAEHIAVGSGSDELIDLILRLTLEPGDRVINCPPTFGMYPFSTGVCGGKIVNVPRGPDYSINVQAIKSAIDQRTRVVFVTSPNNPTGNLTSEEHILQLLETGVLVVVDEAYYEFAGVSVAHLVPSHANLIVLRTFSKWAGLAGLRVGYGILSPQINEVIHLMKLPYNVTIAAKIAARESLLDMDCMQSRIKAILTERERLFQGLKAQGILDPIPSNCNFLLCQVVKGEALEIKQGLEKRGILVRHYDVHRLRDKLRISVGKPEHTDALLLALSG